MKLNTLKSDHVIGQLYKNNVALNEIVVVQYGHCLGLNTDRSWTDVTIADDHFSIRPLLIRAFDVDPTPETKRFVLDIRTNQV